jgi:histidinol-phosphate aminotransferase
LRDAIARYVGVSSDEVIVGCGSDDVLDCACRTFGEPGDPMAMIAPTFLMARVFAVANGLEVKAVPLTATFDADAASLVEARASVTYVCSPNNPTGNLLSATAINHLLQHSPGLVILDEAYAEYSGKSRAVDAPASGRLLVLRTFSKAFGLAGLRIGYGIAAAPLVAELEKARGPYKVTSLGEQAALAALAHDVPWMRRCVEETLGAREHFASLLRQAGYAPLPSAANFVLVPVADATGTTRALASRGIVVRSFPGIPAVGDAVRITVGTRPTMERVVAALGELR